MGALQEIFERSHTAEGLLGDFLIERPVKESAEFDESKHKRANDGKFGSGGGGRSASSAKRSRGTGDGVRVLTTPDGNSFKIRNKDDMREFLAAGGKMPEKSNGPGILAGIGKGLAAAGKGFMRAEHGGVKLAGAAFDKLPTALQLPIAGTLKLFYASYVAANKAVQAVAKEHGLDEHQAAKVAGLMSTLDAVSAKGVIALAGAGASFVPVASVGWLAYSTAKNPMATYRAAKKAVAGVVDKFRRKKANVAESYRRLTKRGRTLLEGDSWDESKHPRADDGTFGSGGGGASGGPAKEESYSEKEARIRDAYMDKHGDAAVEKYDYSRDRIEGIAENVYAGEYDPDTGAEEMAENYAVDIKDYLDNEAVYEMTSRFDALKKQFDDGDLDQDEVNEKAYDHLHEAAGRADAVAYALSSQIEEHAEAVFGDRDTEAFTVFEDEIYKASATFKDELDGVVDRLDTYAYHAGDESDEDEEASAAVDSTYDDLQPHVEAYTAALKSSAEKYLKACAALYEEPVMESWSETDHDRADDGKFSSGGTGSQGAGSQRVRYVSPMHPLVPAYDPVANHDPEVNTHAIAHKMNEDKTRLGAMNSAKYHWAGINPDEFKERTLQLAKLPHGQLEKAQKKFDKAFIQAGKDYDTRHQNELNAILTAIENAIDIRDKGTT